MTIPIIYQNDEIIIINKQTGLAVQGGKGISYSVDTELSKQVGFPIYLVHRLDKDTSGIMIVAKNSKAANIWTKHIEEGRVTKEYVAICIGKFKNKNSSIAEKIIQHGVSKNALTLYNVESEKEFLIKTDTQESERLLLSLVKVRIITGRMHQIRIHFAKQGNPIACDDKHGDFAKNKILRKAGLKKLMLASVSISFPENNSIKTLTVPLPLHMQNIF